MTLFEHQFKILHDEYPGATYRQLPSGAYFVTIPNVQLPEQWSKPATTISFIAPVGYPFGKPDCFWADPDLRLRSGAMPQSANLNRVPEVNEQRLWFSWHATQWNPNRDSLATYVHVIGERLRRRQ